MAHSFNPTHSPLRVKAGYVRRSVQTAVSLMSVNGVRSGGLLYRFDELACTDGLITARVDNGIVTVRDVADVRGPHLPAKGGLAVRVWPLGAGKVVDLGGVPNLVCTVDGCDGEVKHHKGAYACTGGKASNSCWRRHARMTIPFALWAQLANFSSFVRVITDGARKAWMDGVSKDECVNIDLMSALMMSEQRTVADEHALRAAGIEGGAHAVAAAPTAAVLEPAPLAPMAAPAYATAIAVAPGHAPEHDLDSVSEDDEDAIVVQVNLKRRRLADARG